MILVKIYWSTEADGEPVDYNQTDMEDGPISYFGPFDTMTDAISWMENDYPDDDTDVHEMIANDFDLPDHILQHINDPDSLYSDIPDKDVRDY